MIPSNTTSFQKQIKKITSLFSIKVNSGKIILSSRDFATLKGLLPGLSKVKYYLSSSLVVSSRLEIYRSWSLTRKGTLQQHLTIYDKITKQHYTLTHSNLGFMALYINKLGHKSYLVMNKELSYSALQFIDDSIVPLSIQMAIAKYIDYNLHNVSNFYAFKETGLIRLENSKLFVGKHERVYQSNTEILNSLPKHYHSVAANLAQQTLSNYKEFLNTPISEPFIKDFSLSSEIEALAHDMLKTGRNPVTGHFILFNDHNTDTF